MTYYDDIYEHAVDEYYLVTSAEARELGVPAIELVKLADRGRLERIGQGLYRLARNVPSKYDPYATAVKRIGGKARLYGESVIAMLELAPTNPARMFVATPERVRKALPEGLVLAKVPEGQPIARYEGIPCQPVAHAIRACGATMMPERLAQAADNACAQGYMTASERKQLAEEEIC